MKEIKLTKYPFIKGTVCPKSLWLHYNNPELKAELTQSQKMLFAKGNEVGLLARELYEGGIDLSKNNTIYGRNLIPETYSALQSGENIFYEAAFETDDKRMMFVADLCIVAENTIRFIEVKSSTKIKLPDHVYDVGFQYYVINNSNTLDKCGHGEKKIEFYIALINKEYVRNGPIDINQLISLENVTNQAKQVQPLIQRHIKSFESVLARKKCPSTEIGQHCFKGNTCDFINHCWKEVPENSVFTIGRLNKSKAEKLYEDGIVEAHQIPRNVKLSEQQWLEVDSVIANKPCVNKKEIKRFLDSLNLNNPIWFLDFETMIAGIPKFNGTSPYQNICFQYSCLFKKSPESEIVRREFIGKPGLDPRRNFIEQLLKDTVGKGFIIVYNESFEKSRLKELAVLFPEYKEDIDDRISRIRDLMEPFAKRHYYHPSQKGSHSIKVIQPLFAPESDYSKMEIGNGSLAMALYEAMDKMEWKDQILTKRNLLEYCYTDTLVMLKIVNGLEKLVA